MNKQQKRKLEMKKEWSIKEKETQVENVPSRVII
jgi:hypothetical protein